MLINVKWYGRFFGMKYADLSIQLLNRKLKNIKESGATTVAVACPACMMQIGGEDGTNIKLGGVLGVFMALDLFRSFWEMMLVRQRIGAVNTVTVRRQIPDQRRHQILHLHPVSGSIMLVAILGLVLTSPWLPACLPLTIRPC